MFVLSHHRLLIKFVGFHSPEDEWQGYLYAVILFVVAVVQSVCVHQFFILCMVVGMRLRTAVMSVVYKKVCHGWVGWTIHSTSIHTECLCSVKVSMTYSVLQEVAV